MMFQSLLTRFTATLPSSLKYRLSVLKPAYNHLLRLGGSVMQAQTIAGPLNWEVNALTSQQFILGTYETYMQQAFVSMIKPGFTVYDVGAHAGFHSLLCGLLVGSNGLVIAFEPNPINRASVENQLALNPTLPVEVLPFALTDHCGAGRLNTRNGSSQGFLSDNGDLAVEVKSIDSLVCAGDIRPPDLIKIDVEGHEQKVLMGARKTIKKYRPGILCDFNDGSTFSIVSKELEPLGYSIQHDSVIVAVPDVECVDSRVH